MRTDPQIEQILTAIEELRAAGDDGPRKRKLLDTLFRHVHNLKAKASANGLSSLAAAAHELENVLHSLRTQSLTRDARLFIVQTSFDVADFDREFQTLKEVLGKTGEVISTSPRVDKERPAKVNFGILYARKATEGEAMPELSNASVIAIEEISSEHTAIPALALERAFAKFSAELANLPALSFGGVFQQALQAGRAAALATGKEVDFETRGSDQGLNEALCDPVVHLVRNAIDHGIETRGRVVVEIVRHVDHIRITVTDDGRGIDPSLIEKIFEPGFTTAAEVTHISGRGVGLDVVKTTIEDLGGSITVRSERGNGSSFIILIRAELP
ncbi:MAG TPA: ATP-binding protein [Pyrinomonadaceae bacterium]|nr:ATP-binding protein [Pyrinomonadaceae bacterium]